MKLILQFAVFVCIGAINTAVYDERDNYLSLIAGHEKEPDTRKAKHRNNNVISQNLIANKNGKYIMKQAYYKDVMLSNKKNINIHMKTNDQQRLSNKQKSNVKKIKDIDGVLNSVHNKPATPNPIKKLWNKLNEIVVETKPQYQHDELIVRYVYRPTETNKYHQDTVEEKLNNIKTTNRFIDSDKENNGFKMDSATKIIQKVRRRGGSDSSSSSSSSSDEIVKWKEQFKEQYMKKKYEALNASRPAGDVVNMVAARPWGVPCGDPNQHDIPWGTCMLQAECESEYRIFRGDYFCGRSEFVCCATQLNDNDMYQGFDISFDSKSLSTDSDDRKENNKDSKEKRKKRKERERKKRKKGRRKRMAKIKKNIKKIVREMRKLLDKQFKNGTKQRKQKTRLLKKFIKKLKKQYKEEREAVADIHEEEMIRIDAALQRKLNELMEMNKNFVNNETFREIVVNGAINKKGARMLLEAYPDLDPYLHKTLRKSTSRKTRKFGGYSEDHFSENAEYDLEYGYLYFE